MIELIEMCGFEPGEAKTELPRLERVFNKLGISSEDIRDSKKRLNLYYDMELKGIRKIFRLCLREMTNSILAREEGKNKIIFGFMAPIRSSKALTNSTGDSFLLFMACASSTASIQQIS